MRPYCPAIRHFRNCHGNLRRSLTFKARWSDRLECRLHKRRSSGSSLCTWFLVFLSLSPLFFPLPFQFFFKWMPSHIINLPFGLDNTVLGLCIVPPCGRANTATLELNIPSHAIIYLPALSTGYSSPFGLSQFTAKPPMCIDIQA